MKNFRFLILQFSCGVSSCGSSRIDGRCRRDAVISDHENASAPPSLRASDSVFDILRENILAADFDLVTASTFARSPTSWV